MKKSTTGIKTLAACLFFAISLIAIISCKKNSGTPAPGTGYLRFTVDGVKVETFPTPAVSLNAISGIYDLGVSGFKDKDFNNESIIISLGSKTKIDHATSFSSTQLLSSGSTVHYPALHILYYDKANAEYTSLFGDNTWTNIPALTATATDAVLVITEITASNVKGTFSGTVYSQISISKKYKITDGEFSLPKY